MLWSRLIGIVLLALCLSLAACANTDEPADATMDEASPEMPPGVPPGGVASTPPGGTRTGVEGLPETKQATLLLEGRPEPVTLRLFATPQDFPLPFYTYHPDDLLAQRITVGDYGETIRFTANFGGTLRNDAFVQFYMFPEAIMEEDARVILRSDAEDRGAARSEGERRFSWSLEEYAINDANLVGTMALGEHNGRYFQLFVAHPPEYGDGFGPRAALVLDQWRWLDTGTALGE